ncbi:MAG: AEC family transporter [Pseudomonadota bacterium]
MPQILQILEIVLPVFLIVGAGYGGVRIGFFKSVQIDALLFFATRFAIPCLLFDAMVNLDLGETFEPRFLLSYYASATAAFVLTSLAAWKLFGRRPGESIAIGFCALFANSILLGLPVFERAYGADAMGPSFAIIAMHAPYCYALGIIAMEMARADGRAPRDTAAAALKAMFSNALAIGLALGLAVNLTATPLPGFFSEAVSLIGRAGLPIALFGLGGVLTRYALTSGLAESATATFASLAVHPALAWWLTASVFELPPEFVRAAVVTAAMPPGVNAFLFAQMYDRALDVAAATVLLATLAAVLSASLWLAALQAAFP